jgi:hypothetical protein
VPREERWIPATLSKAAKVLWKGVKIVLAVPTDEELKSYSRMHPPPGHVPVHIPLGTGSVDASPYRPPRSRKDRSGRRSSIRRSGSWDRDCESLRSMSSGPPPAASSAGNTTWPRLSKDDYGSQLRKL